MHPHRPEIGVYSKLFAQTEQSLLRAQSCVWIVPARTADRAEQHRIGSSANLQRSTRQWSAARIDRAATDQSFVQLECVVPALCHRSKDANALGDYLGPDAVAWKNRDSQRVHTRAGCTD